MICKLCWTLLLAAVAVPATMSARTTPQALVDGLPIAALPQQQLPASGCAAFLWTKGASRQLVAMVTEGALRYAPGGRITDLPRTTIRREGMMGIAADATYTAGSATVAADLTIVQQQGLQQGALIPEGTISIGAAGEETVVVPVAGLVGCA